MVEITSSFIRTREFAGIVVVDNIFVVHTHWDRVGGLGTGRLELGTLLQGFCPSFKLVIVDLGVVQAVGVEFYPNSADVSRISREFCSLIWDGAASSYLSVGF